MPVNSGVWGHAMGRRTVLQSLVSCTLAPLTMGQVLAADEASKAIAVVFPDIGEPFRGMFTSIISGVEERVRGRVFNLPVGASTLSSDVMGELRRRDIQGVIALGRQGLKIATGLDAQLSVVAAGVLSVPEVDAQNFPVFSLAPDPALLFARLRVLSPQSRRVLVIHDPRQNDWLMRLARDAARASGIELQAWEAEDLRTATRLYQEALALADGRRDALWLPQDSTTVEDSAVLPLVLRESWRLSLPVFSSGLAPVKRGVLFALYPNHPAMGRALASALLTQLSGGGAPGRGVQPLRDVLLAVNTRTASHLGVKLSASSLHFNLAFPEP